MPPSNNLAQAQATLIRLKAQATGFATQMAKAMSGFKFSEADRFAGLISSTTNQIAKQIGVVNSLSGSTSTLGATWRKTGAEVADAVSQAGRAALVAGGVLGVTMKNAMAHWNPAAVSRFEQRLGDLASVIGEIVAPAFAKLTDQIYQWSNWLLNLSPQTKEMINDWIAWLVPITAVGIVLGGLMGIITPLITIMLAGIPLVTAAWWALAAAARAAAVAMAMTPWGAVAAIAGIAAGAAVTYALTEAFEPMDSDDKKKKKKTVNKTTPESIEERLIRENPTMSESGKRKLRDLSGKRAEMDKSQEKDSTGRDALRQVSTTSNVLDVGRRMRELALTNAGREETPDPNTKATAEEMKWMNEKMDAIQGWMKSVADSMQRQGIS